MSFFISNALAAAPSAVTGVEGNYSSIVMLVIFVVVFYFLLLRPQSQRAKQHKNLIAGLTKGDEVVSSGGIIGKISKVSDDFVTLEIADGLEIRLQRSAVVASLPKGTIKAI